MLMYHSYIPLSQPFSPCLALAREIVNTFLEMLIYHAHIRFLSRFRLVSLLLARL